MRQETGAAEWSARFLLRRLNRRQAPGSRVRRGDAQCVEMRDRLPGVRKPFRADDLSIDYADSLGKREEILLKRMDTIADAGAGVAFLTWTARLTTP